MSFKSIFSNCCLSIDYDKEYDCLFLSLHGQLGFPAPQEIKQKVTNIQLVCPTSCLVQDNLAITEIGMVAADWLATQLLPALHQAGVERWTWVCSPTLRSQYLAEQVARRSPRVQLTVFNDLENATTWLRRLL